MESQRFSGPDDPFGYFGGSATPAVVGTAGPAAAQPAPPALPAPPAAAPTRSPLLLVAMGVLVVALVGGGWWWVHRDTIVLPDQLGGLSRNSAFEGGGNLGQLSLTTPAGDVKEELAGYGPTPVETVLVVAQGTGLGDTAAAQEQSASVLQHIGAASCFSASGVVMCNRAQGNLSILVESRAPGATTASVAAMVQQAWDAQ